MDVEHCAWINQKPCVNSPIIAEKTLKTEQIVRSSLVRGNPG